MNDFMEFLQAFWPTLVSGVVAITSAIVGVISVIRGHRFAKYLDDARQRETYIECPHCKKKIPMSEISFHLPTGEVDNNLNGKPDNQEF